MRLDSLEPFSVEADISLFTFGDIFRRMIGLKKPGQVHFCSEEAFTMTGTDKVYDTDDIRDFRYWIEDKKVTCLEVQLWEDIDAGADKDEFYRFAVYGEDVGKVYGWLICHYPRRFVRELREGKESIRSAMEPQVAAQLRQWQREEDETIHLPPERLGWQEVPWNVRQWVCAVNAVNRRLNHWDIHEFGGFQPYDPIGRASASLMLSGRWDTNSRPEMICNLQELVAGEKGVYDLQRACQLSGSAFLAGYITLREAMNCAVTAGQRIQKLVHSWEEMSEAYVKGYAEELEDEEGAKVRAEIFRELKESAENPYALPFDTPLVRTW